LQLRELQLRELQTSQLPQEVLQLPQAVWLPEQLQLLEE
jgi:hypothetical protein